MSREGFTNFVVFLRDCTLLCFIVIRVRTGARTWNARGVHSARVPLSSKIMIDRRTGTKSSCSSGWIGVVYWLIEERCCSSGCCTEVRRDDVRDARIRI